MVIVTVIGTSKTTKNDQSDHGDDAAAAVADCDADAAADTGADAASKNDHKGNGGESTRATHGDVMRMQMLWPKPRS